MDITLLKLNNLEFKPLTNLEIATLYLRGNPLHANSEFIFSMKKTWLDNNRENRTELYKSYVFLRYQGFKRPSFWSSNISLFLAGSGPRGCLAASKASCKTNRQILLKSDPPIEQDFKV